MALLTGVCESGFDAGDHAGRSLLRWSGRRTRHSTLSPTLRGFRSRPCSSPWTERSTARRSRAATADADPLRPHCRTASGGVDLLDASRASTRPEDDNPYWVAAGLIEGSDGNFYGTTQGGGEQAPRHDLPHRTAPAQITTVHSFSGPRRLGNRVPLSWKVRAGVLYGTAARGGVPRSTARSFGWSSTATVSRCCTTSRRSSRDSRNGTD